MIVTSYACSSQYGTFQKALLVRRDEEFRGASRFCNSSGGGTQILPIFQQGHPDFAKYYLSKNNKRSNQAIEVKKHMLERLKSTC